MDPLDEFHSPYTYVGNNPINLVDPDGCNSDEPPFKIASLNLQYYSIGLELQASFDQIMMQGGNISSQGGFIVGFGDGFYSGGKSTWDFLTSLGSLEGWSNLGKGVSFQLNLLNPNGGYAEKFQVSFQASALYEQIPGWDAYDWGYASGFGTEKIIEGALLTKGAGLTANSIKSGFGEALFADSWFGVKSPLFGIRSFRGNNPSIFNNPGLFKIGWSGGDFRSAGLGGGYLFRIGIGTSQFNPNHALKHIDFHKTFVPNEIGNKYYPRKRM